MHDKIEILFVMEMPTKYLKLLPEDFNMDEEPAKVIYAKLIASLQIDSPNQPIKTELILENVESLSSIYNKKYINLIDYYEEKIKTLEIKIKSIKEELRNCQFTEKSEKLEQQRTIFELNSLNISLNSQLKEQQEKIKT